MGVSYNFPLPLIDQIIVHVLHYSSCYILCCIDDIVSCQWIFKLELSKYMLICNCFSFCSFGLLMCLLTLNEGGPEHLSQVSQHSKCIHMTNVITNNLHDDNEIMVLVV